MTAAMAPGWLMRLEMKVLHSPVVPDGIGSSGVKAQGSGVGAQGSELRDRSSGRRDAFFHRP
jgi:hypothetical protein